MFSCNATFHLIEWLCACLSPHSTRFSSSRSHCTLNEPMSRPRETTCAQLNNKKYIVLIYTTRHWYISLRSFAGCIFQRTYSNLFKCFRSRVNEFRGRATQTKQYSTTLEVYNSHSFVVYSHCAQPGWVIQIKPWVYLANLRATINEYVGHDPRSKSADCKCINRRRFGWLHCLYI